MTDVCRVNDPHEFLRTLALVLGVAAAATIVFQRLRQPVVFGYLVAGMIIGPHVPIPLVADEAMVRDLSELGVILLMFSLGLEFSLRKLFAVGPTASADRRAAVQRRWSGSGIVVGRLFGWTRHRERVRGRDHRDLQHHDHREGVRRAGDPRRGFAEIVFGVLIVEDLIAIFLLAVLTAISAGGRHLRRRARQPRPAGSAAFLVGAAGGRDC